MYPANGLSEEISESLLTILTVCCSIPFEAAMALAAEVAAEPADPGLLLAELTATSDADDSDDGGIEDATAAARDVATDDGTTPNTDAGELY